MTAPMIDFTISQNKFKFEYLPDYANWLIANKLEEFVIIGIRFSREVDLPLLKPLSKYSEKELVAISLESNKRILDAMASNTLADHIEANARKWITNTLVVVDKDDIAAEDITLVFYLRRKNFAYFLDAYTKNVVLQKFIITELDQYTTQEELVCYNIYLKMQTQKIAQINADLAFHKELLLEAQELAGTGSFLINYQDESKSVYTPEYQRIFELDSKTTFNKFIQWVHPEDQDLIKRTTEAAYKTGGKYEVQYRYKKGDKEKRIWSKGFTLVEDGKPMLVRGIVKEIS